MNFTAEQIRKASACGSVDELAAFAKAQGVELTDDEAGKYFSAISAKELSPDDLDGVTGAGESECKIMDNPHTC